MYVVKTLEEEYMVKPGNYVSALTELTKINAAFCPLAASLPVSYFAISFAR